MLFLSTSTSLYLLIAVPVFISTVSAYTWPSPQYDALEELLYEGVTKSSIPVFNINSVCQSRVSQGGPTIGAEWLRLAYHDMATHNITDGTGGLDASIYYELQRAENVGAGMINTLFDFSLASNKYVSRADVIAMGAVWGVAGCNGPPLRYRGGRIDASGPGRRGVPEPDQDLESHAEAFKLQGFNATEMIRLVACGHTLGGVRAVDFPFIVADKDEGQPTVDLFDSTQTYDNAVVVEYLEGTTQNPLVVSANTTAQSDLRIFSSDGNVTMKSMESHEAFDATCQTLLKRMVEVVPIGIQLTEEIKMLPFKVKTAQLVLNGSDIIFNVVARVALARFNPAMQPTPAPNVQLFWCDRAGPSADCEDGSANFALPASTLLPGSVSPLTGQLNTIFQPYVFRALINPATSVGKFWFGMRNSDTEEGSAVLQANGGKGYILQQDVLVSALDLDILVEPPAIIGQTAITMGVGIKLGSEFPTVVEMRVFDNGLTVLSDGDVPVQPPLNFTVLLRKVLGRTPVGGYTLYAGNFTDSVSLPSVDFAVEVGGVQYGLDFVQTPSRFKIFDGDNGGLSKVGKMSLGEAMFGGQVDVKIVR